MNSNLTVIIQKERNWFVSFCPEVPGANGQGITKEESLESLKEAIKLIFADRREGALKKLENSNFIKESMALV